MNEITDEPEEPPPTPDLPDRVTAATAGEVLEAMVVLARQVFAAVEDESAGWSREQLHDQIATTQQILNSIGATQVERIARFARSAEGEPWEFAPDELAPTLGWGPRKAEDSVMDALAAFDKTPGLVSAAGDGRMEPWRINLVTDELHEASWRTCERVEEDLLRGGVTHWTGGRTRSRARALVRRHEPAAARRRATKRAEQQIGVTCFPGQDHGTTQWHATLWSKDAHRAFAAVEELARQIHEDGRAGITLGQCRADAMCDLILANAHVTTDATVLVAVDTTRVPEPGDAEASPDITVPGAGVIPRQAVNAMLRDLGTTITTGIIDRATGALLGTSCRTYRPTTGLRRQLELRDRHCRFPGCTKPARWCDADHVTPWPTGPTDLTNLQLLCRHHHRAKHHGDWKVTMDAEGACHWTGRSGRVFTTKPGLTDVIADLTVLPDTA